MKKMRFGLITTLRSYTFCTKNRVSKQMWTPKLNISSLNFKKFHMSSFARLNMIALLWRKLKDQLKNSFHSVCDGICISWSYYDHTDAKLCHFKATHSNILLNNLMFMTNYVHPFHKTAIFNSDINNPFRVYSCSQQFANFSKCSRFFLSQLKKQFLALILMPHTQPNSRPSDDQSFWPLISLMMTFGAAFE